MLVTKNKIKIEKFKADLGKISQITLVAFLDELEKENHICFRKYVWLNISEKITILKLSKRIKRTNVTAALCNNKATASFSYSLPATATWFDISGLNCIYVIPFLNIVLSS